MEHCMLQEAAERIGRMERYFDALLKAESENPAAIREDASLREQLQILARYYEGGQWLRDYEMDEQGLLPPDLKRGVLSQDALYDFLERKKDGVSHMNITHSFYDDLAPQYDKLFLDWQAATQEQAVMLGRIFRDRGFGKSARILDCACGIGTQTIGLAALGYDVTASDFSEGALSEAKERAANNRVQVQFVQADFCALSKAFEERFDIVIAMDNALPHMLTAGDLETAVRSITNQITEGGIFVASIRDYDALLQSKPPYSPPYIHKTARGQRVSFQTWEWEDDCYHLTQYIIEDEGTLQVSRFACSYRATRREELTNLLLASGCREVAWLFPEETGFYQPIVIAGK